MEKKGFLAADVSKGYADFTLWSSDGQCLEPAFKLMDNKEGHAQAKQLCKAFAAQHSLSSIIVGMESTGGYENNWFLLFKSMQTQGISQVMRINPKAVKAMGTARMVRTITDAVSADNIAQYMISFMHKAPDKSDNKFTMARHVGAWIRNINKQITQTSNHLEKLVYQTFPELLIYCRHGFPAWLLQLLAKYPLPADVIKAGKARLTRLNNITEDKATALINKAKTSVAGQLPNKYLATTIQGMVTVLQCNYQQIEQQKHALAEQFKDLQEVQLLDSIPGIGIDSAIFLLMDIEDISNYQSAKQLCAQFGMHPTFKQSGDGTWSSRLSKMGRSSVRGTLYMPALAAIRWNAYFKDLYATHRTKGKTHRQAICVVMHKMLTMIFGILKSKKPFDISIHTTNQQQAVEKQQETIKKQQQNKKEKKSKRERYIDGNQLEAPISRKQSKAIKKELPVPIDKNQAERDPEALAKNKQILCLFS